jgi:hypothetical protein
VTILILSLPGKYHSGESRNPAPCLMDSVSSTEWLNIFIVRGWRLGAVTNCLEFTQRQFVPEICYYISNGSPASLYNLEGKD